MCAAAWYGADTMYAANQRRQEQIQDLLQRRPECTPRNHDRSVIDFGLNVKRGIRSDLVVIRVTLPPAFPNAPPHVAVLTKGVKHNWIDTQGTVVGCSSLYGWNQHSRLVDIVSDVMNHFMEYPPMVEHNSNGESAYGAGYPGSRPVSYQSPQTSLAGARPNSMSMPGSMIPPPPNASSSSSSSSHSNSQQHNDNDDGILIPPAPDSFPELENMNLEELQKLQNDEKEFQKFFSSMPVPTMTLEMKEQIVSSNEKQARANMSHKDTVEKLQETIFALHEEALSQWKTVCELEEKQAIALRKFDPLRLLTQLEASCSKVDDESELLASEFLNEEVALQDFVKRQLELRKLYHLRRAKAERFRSQIKQ